MSHFTTIKTKLYDHIILKETLSSLNLPWSSGTQEIKGYKGQVHPAEILIKQSNNYDIGFKWDGKRYNMVADLMFWDQAVSYEKFLNQINQRYAYHSITQILNKSNYEFVQSTHSENGSIRVTLRKYV
jgi:hypothetical protein